jgi:hypothetical protein
MPVALARVALVVPVQPALAGHGELDQRAADVGQVGGATRTAHIRRT